MVEVIFNYNGIDTIIQCKLNDKMKDIINKYIFKIRINKDNIYFIYNGDKMNEGLELNELINENDKNRKKMNILVNENGKTNKGEIKIKSKEIICPECKENILFNLKDYKINLYECKNNHIKNNILLNEFENTQLIDLSKIICNECKIQTQADTYNNEFYICNSCGIKLCPICKLKHDKNHNIINYNDKNFICKKHNDTYIKYCKECKENLCLLCEKEHNYHKLIYLGDIIINKDDILEEMKELNNIINKFKNKIDEIKNILNKIINNIEIYYKININIINNYEIKNKNYEILNNLNEIRNNNKSIISDLNNIIKEDNVKNIFNYIINIYNKMNNNNKKIYENGDKYIGELINNLRNGKGILYYNKDNKYNRNKYEGEWENDKFEGKGIMYWNNGDRYEGFFKSDKIEGKGIYYWNSIGDRYEGDFKNDKKEGKGIYYYNNGDIYEGDWKNDKRDGKGIYYYNNGDREMGDYSDGKQIGIQVKLNNKGEVTTNKFSLYNYITSVFY